MSAKHPIIAVTGSSGAGTTSVTRTFEWIFRRERIHAQIIEGDSFHRYNREEMKAKMAEATKAGNNHLSHFGPENNLFEELESLFKGYGASGGGRYRRGPVRLFARRTRIRCPVHRTVGRDRRPGASG